MSDILCEYTVEYWGFVRVRAHSYEEAEEIALEDLPEDAEIYAVEANI